MELDTLLNYTLLIIHYLLLLIVLPLHIFLEGLDSLHHLLVLTLEAAQNLRLAHVLGEGIVHLHGSLASAHHPVLGLENLREGLLSLALHIRLEVHPVASPILATREYHPAPDHLRLVTDYLRLVPWRLAH